MILGNTIDVRLDLTLQHVGIYINMIHYFRGILYMPKHLLINAVDFVRKLPKSLTVVGSVSRREPTIGDIDMVTTQDLEKIEKMIERKKDLLIRRKIKKGSLHRQYSIRYGNKTYKLDIWKTTPSRRLFALIAYGLKKGENIGLRKRAKELGYLLSSTGLTKKGRRVKIRTFEELLERLDIKKRENLSKTMRRILSKAKVSY